MPFLEATRDSDRLTSTLFQSVCELKEAVHLHAAASGTESVADFINSRIPDMGGVIQRSLETQILIIIGRLSDGAGRGRRRNASFRRLQEIRTDAGIGADDRVNEFLEIGAHLKDARDKFYAHSDLDQKHEKTSAGSISQYLKAVSLACDIVSDFTTDVFGYDSLFSVPQAANEFRNVCKQFNVECASQDEVNAWARVSGE